MSYKNNQKRAMQTMALMLGCTSLILTQACGKDDKNACKAAARAAVPRPACADQMFSKYTLNGFSAVNTAIIQKATAESIVPEIGDSFQTKLVKPGDSARVSQFTTNLANFLVMAYGGPNNYTGPSMKDAHKDLGITGAQYDAFISKVVVPALQEVGVSADDISNCFAPVVTNGGLANDIIACD